MASRLRTLELVFLIGIGGFAGANLRYVVSLAVSGPAGTFVVNVLGCLVLGALVYEAELAGVLAEETGFVAITGFLSSFTTFSTFALEAVRAAPLVGIVYVLATYCCGFLAVRAGGRAALALEALR
jgi:CrcB protein